MAIRLKKHITASVCTKVMALFLLCTIYSCEKYNLDRTNPRDDEAENYNPQVPNVSTSTPTNISSTSVTIGAMVSSDGNSKITSRGICYGLDLNPTTSDSKATTGGDLGSFAVVLSGLTPYTTYNARAFATNAKGPGYGTNVVFTTLGFPILSTTTITSITANSASSGGTITNDGGASVTEYGVCWSISQNPTVANSHTNDGSGTGSFASSILGLTGSTAYYLRSYATNSVGTAYGNQVSFTTKVGVTDIDGNTYNIVQIGSQLWMKENLKTTKFNNDTSIPLVTDITDWSNLSTPGYCWSNNDAATYKATYGALYNWYSVNTGNLCPTGWHMPTDAEWTILTNYLGGVSAAGGKLKEIGTAHWASPNSGATNESDFIALPGGARYDFGTFWGNGYYGTWWSATEYDAINSWYRLLGHNYSNVYRLSDGNKKSGSSVRCLSD